ncbi:MAG TPA: outer membrane beta-barrel protein [Saprospiraceae bacterium]|nr:outer membrane beta-barrel protein [Saprospiraceae bacterium]
MKILVSLLFLNSVFFITKLSGQEVIAMLSRTHRLSAGANAGFISYTSPRLHTNTETGFGYGMFIQYGFNHRVAASFSYQHFAIKSQDGLERVVNSPYPYNDLSLTGKYFFGSTTTKLRPNLAIVINYTKSKENNQYTSTYLSHETFSGLSFGGGGGLSYFVDPQVSIDISILYNTGTYTTNYQDGFIVDFTYKFSSIKGFAGVSYHF